MNTKHTPGPWEVREDDGEYNVHAADSYSCGFRVQMRIAEDVGGYRKQLEDGSWSDAEVIANAHLLSAAPELLAACMAEQMAVIYDSDPGSRDADEAIRVLASLGYADDDDRTPSEFASTLRRHAIDKATGEQA